MRELEFNWEKLDEAYERMCREDLAVENLNLDEKSRALFPDYLSVREAAELLRAEELKLHFRRFEKRRKQRFRLGGLSLAVAASIVVFTLVGILGKGNESYIAEFWTVDPGPELLMAADTEYDSLYLAATVAFNKKQFMESYTGWELLLKQEPESAVANYYAGLSSFELGDWHKTQAFLAAVPETSPYYLQAKIRLAALAAESGELNNACEVLKEVKQHVSILPEPFVQLAKRLACPE